MTRGGRPLRFLAVTLGGWTAGRAFFLWQTATAGGVPGTVPAEPSLAGPQVTAGAATPASGADWLPGVWPSPAAGGHVVVRLPPTARHVVMRLPPAAAPARRQPWVATALAVLVRDGREQPLSDGAIHPPTRPAAIAGASPPGRSRLAGSAWLIARGGASGTLLGGQLGASQAGARLTYALGASRRIALSARFATPLRGPGKEAAVGFDWQPTRAPVHLLAEQRFSLDGGGGGPSLLVIGGIDPTPIVAGVRLEAYAQAGVIARGPSRGGVEAFGDGAARLTRTAVSLGAVRLDAGAGAWGAAQRGTRRLDVGPTLGAVMPVAGKALRATVDWRQRIAGNARPGSGPALSVGVDF